MYFKTSENLTDTDKISQAILFINELFLIRKFALKY
jgi:hypothetical protein